MAWGIASLGALTLLCTLWVRQALKDNAIQADDYQEEIMGAVQDAVDQVVGQLNKAKGEITSAIASLEAQVAAGEVPDLTALKAAAQSLDDVVADAPAEPEPEPEPEPVEVPADNEE